MFQRPVRIGEGIYRSHEPIGIEHTRERTVVHAKSHELADGTGRGIDTWHEHEADDALTFSLAEEWLKTIPAFEEAEDPAQAALDEVLPILTDEQAETVPDVFPAWAAGVAYAQGVRVRYGGNLYRCIQAHTSQEGWTPDATPALWTRIGEPADDWPEWVQPTGAHDAYAAGAKVSHDGGHWTSDVDANIWEPGVYGWTEVA
ncbi:MAG: hypothetical protein IJ111_13470 [Eggerthellaceae bacterium]|nr:hypothetical protein [Eggerthellaceae bacterium]